MQRFLSLIQSHLSIIQKHPKLLGTFLQALWHKIISCSVSPIFSFNNVMVSDPRFRSWTSVIWIFCLFVVFFLSEKQIFIEREQKAEKNTLHPLVHSPNSCNKQRWANTMSGARASFRISYKGEEAQENKGSFLLSQDVRMPASQAEEQPPCHHTIMMIWYLHKTAIWHLNSCFSMGRSNTSQHHLFQRLSFL